MDLEIVLWVRNERVTSKVQLLTNLTGLLLIGSKPGFYVLRRPNLVGAAEQQLVLPQSIFTSLQDAMICTHFLLQLLNVLK